MTGPCNPTDFKRFQKLAKALSEVHPPVSLKLYADSRNPHGSTYVSIEMTGTLDTDLVNQVFGLKVHPAAPPTTSREEQEPLAGQEENLDHFDHASGEQSA